MFKNYLKVAIRNIWKNKAFSALNIIGLASGLAVSLLIVLYVKDELSYDQFNVNANNIYRLDADIYFNNTEADMAVAPDPLPVALVRDYPEVAQMVRINAQGDILIKKDNQNIHDHHSAFVDSTFFKVFTFPMIAGDPKTALDDPNSIIIDKPTIFSCFLFLSTRKPKLILMITKP
jgi:putative ABC transport system permease protein